VSGFGSLALIELMRRSQGWNNTTLLALLISIVAYSVAALVFFYYLIHQRRQNFIAAAFLLAAQNACHWIITETYVKVSFETRMLLDKKTYTKSAQELG
jgi:hypothetical protein